MKNLETLIKANHGHYRNFALIKIEGNLLKIRNKFTGTDHPIIGTNDAYELKLSVKEIRFLNKFKQANRPQNGGTAENRTVIL